MFLACAYSEFETCIEVDTNTSVEGENDLLPETLTTRGLILLRVKDSDLAREGVANIMMTTRGWRLDIMMLESRGDAGNRNLWDGVLLIGFLKHKSFRRNRMLAR